jgi:excisionase family DNA binding protein
MTPEEAASMLGTPRLYVVRQAKLGKIPAIKVGKAWRFRLSTIEAWLASNERRAGETVTPDVLVHNEGTVFLFNPLTSRAKEWIDDNVQPDAQWFTIAKRARKIHDVPFIEFLKEPPARRGFIAIEKFDDLVNLLPTHLRPLVTLLYYCGTRIGEALQIE